MEEKIYADIQMIETEKLKPNDYNPNIMEEEKFQSLVQDFKENGFVGQPIIVDKNNEIIDGEHRWRASSACGFKKVPVVYFNPKNEEHKKILTIGWNTKRGEFSPMKLAEIIQGLSQNNNLEELSGKLGFKTNQLEDILEVNKLTPEFVENLKKESEKVEAEIPVIMNFALDKNQEEIVNEALEISMGKTKGEKLAYICNAYLKEKPRNEEE
jgi:ParB/RepB/Spo0J family partition protein